MTFERIKWDDAFPGVAASNIGAWQAVALAASAVEAQFVPISSQNVEPFGIAAATAGAVGLASVGLVSAVPVLDDGNTVKVTAAASLGAGADIGVTSASTSLGPVAGIAGSVIWRVGRSVSPANAGELFALYVKPRQLSGTP